MFCDIAIDATVLNEAKDQVKLIFLCCAEATKGTSALFQVDFFLLLTQDPSVLSVTRNAAPGIKEFNPFEDPNSSQVSNGDCKVVRFPFSRMQALSVTFPIFGFEFRSVNKFAILKFSDLYILATVF